MGDNVFLALKMRVRLQGENRYRVVAIDRLGRTLEKLKNAILHKFADRKIKEIQRILLWPDKLSIELVDDYDCELLEESCEIEIETVI